MKLGKLSKILIAGVTSMVLLVGCGGTGNTAKTENSTSKEDTFTYGIDGDPGNSVLLKL